MMVRTLYACLLLLHPPEFRRRFTSEMLCIFDEAGRSMGVFALLFDGVVSLARQWVLRSGSWKVAAAVLGACLQVTAGGLIWMLLGHGGRLHVNSTAPDVLALGRLMQFTVASVGGIVLTVAAASLWMGSFVRKRAQSLRVGR
jgi:hypothetical protein